MIKVHYAVQACDVKSYQNSKRFCGDDRTLLSKKSLKSLINSIKRCSDLKPDTHHFINVITDNCTEDLTSFIEKLIKEERSTNITIELNPLSAKTGIIESIRSCYQWLDNYGCDFVFQVQDDYLFSPDCIYDSLQHFYVALTDFQTDCIIQPYNDVTYWNFIYKNRATPRLISLGEKGYWIQIYDTSCSFLTSHRQFKQHWDLYEKFFELIPHASLENNVLENKSLNLMFTERSVLGLTPINTLSHHIQTQPDLYVDWRAIWDLTVV